MAREIAADPHLFEVVFRGMLGSDPLVRMRAADAVEKATRRRPELLQPYTGALLREVAAVDQQEVRWHLAQMLPRLALDATEQEEARAILNAFLRDERALVEVNAIQALADLAGGDESHRRRVVADLEHPMAAGSPALKARGRKLLAKLAGDGTARSLPRGTDPPRAHRGKRGGTRSPPPASVPPR